MDNRPPPRPAPGMIDAIASQSNRKNKQGIGHGGAGGGGSALTNRRQAFANRTRTLSSGSTRGAFGLMPIQDPHNHHHHHNQQQHYNHHENQQQPQHPSHPLAGSHRNSKLNLTSDASPSSRNRGDEETGRVHPLFRVHSNRSYHSNDDSNDTYRRVPSPSAHIPGAYEDDVDSPPLNWDDMKLEAQKNMEIQMFASMAAEGSSRRQSHVKSPSPNHKYAHYGTSHPQDLSWTQNDQNTVNSFDASLGPEMEEPSFPRQIFRTIFFDPVKPEFTTLQQTTWAVLLGVFMGLFTAAWGKAVETSVDFVWNTVPKFLLEKGIFTDLQGHLPLPHYIWICPAIFGGILSYVTAKYAEYDMTIPGQNEWIESLHYIGVMDHSRFFAVIVMSTLGMASGLSLGPEMPLVLSSGMVGSWLALKAKQSVLSARVMNLVAASAAIGGFFGFPMAGALFVLELPHRMGLQYFEALSPCVISSIISVITNRMVTKKFVEGYFKYPFLEERLSSEVYYSAVIYGIYGTLVGILYADLALWCKKWVHDWFHVAHEEHGEDDEKDMDNYENETTALMGMDKEDYYMESSMTKKKHQTVEDDSGVLKRVSRSLTNMLGIEHEPTRAAVAGVLVGIVVGLICMFLPHQLFWGEAQLQSLIDKGKTPLPVFEYEGPSSILTAYGYCMIGPEDERKQILGYSTNCLGVLAFTKILTIGLSLGTGICGGHFWGPLYVGCAAGHFFTDILLNFKNDSVLANQLSMYPCIVILCVMGSVHVVTYRCHMAIVLVLTLTITSFTAKDAISGAMAGDYSAIFPLLVVACFVPLAAARGTTFYGKQRCRGDISATTWVLSKASLDPDTDSFYQDDDYYDGSLGAYSDDDDDVSSGLSLENESVERTGGAFGMDASVAGTTKQTSVTTSQVEYESEDLVHIRKSSNSSSNPDPLGISMHSIGNTSKRSGSGSRGRSLSREASTARRKPSLGRASSFGMDDFQLTLLDQSRVQHGSVQASSRSSTPVPTNGPSIPRGHRRKGSNISVRSNAVGDMDVSRHSSRSLR